MPLGLIPKFFYHINIIRLFKKLMGMVYPMMVKLTDIQCIIGWIGIRINNTVRITYSLIIGSSVSVRALEIIAV